MPEVFAVFEGGGVKGIAHVGALARFHEETELKFKGYAGTSAGAIVAALAAVGYRARNTSSLPSSISPPDLSTIMAHLDFDKLLGDRSMPLNKLRSSVESFRSALPRLVKVGEELQRLANASWRKRLWEGRALLQTYQPELQMLQELPELLQRFSVKRGMYETDTLVTWLQKYLRHRPELLARNGRVTFTDAIQS
jgi:hypothetical protein